MQIQGPSQVHGPQALQGPHRIDNVRSTNRTARSETIDQLDISAEADFVSRSKELPEIRSEKVADIKARIADGTYFSDEKLDIALDRLLDEFG